MNKSLLIVNRVKFIYISFFLKKKEKKKSVAADNLNYCIWLYGILHKLCCSFAKINLVKFD